MKKMIHFFLHRYEGSDFFIRRKAGLIVFFSFALVAMVWIVAGLHFAFSGLERGIQFTQSAVVATIASLVTLVFLRKGRHEISGAILVTLCAVIVAVGLLMRAPHLGYVTMVYFMFATLLFASLFSTAWNTSLIMAGFVAASTAYYILSKDKVEGLLAESLKSGFIDSLAALTLSFLIGLLAKNMFQNTFRMISDEKMKNEKSFNILKNLLSIIRESSLKMTSFANGMAGTLKTFYENEQNQAASVEEITASMGEVSANVSMVNLHTGDQHGSLIKLIDSINGLADAIDLLKGSSEDVARTFESILQLATEGENTITLIDADAKDLLDSSNRLSSVMSIIQDIFDKIQLLALNASIEAARAGEHGRGFAVVADEVNKLAEQSVSSLKDIDLIIKGNARRVLSGNENVLRAINLIREIIANVKVLENRSRDIFRQIDMQEGIKQDIHVKADVAQQRSGEIRDATREQSLTIAEIAKAVSSINAMIQSNADGSRTLLSSADDLKKMADGLMKTIEELQE